MSRAFTREEDSENAVPDVGERPVSAHRNLVTGPGLRQIETEVRRLRGELAGSEAAQDKQKMALAARDLRYWMARRESAELSEPDPDGSIVRFGMTVAIEDDEGKRVRWRIVGEDEADPSQGTISHVSPMAVALFGKTVGDIASVNGREWEIVAVLGEDQRTTGSM